ncbi:MAG: hypothetical protein K2N72_13245 [Oscillospiraceae bacterium]|nr:hypothetical protein [Oscillospiraceae bacterium]
MNKRKLLKILTVAFVILSVLLFVIALGQPSGVSYTYEGNEIVTHSKRDDFAEACAIFFPLSGVWFIALTIVEIVLSIKEKRGVFNTVINAGAKILTGFFCGVLLFLVVLPSDGLWPNYPEWYMFTDGSHTIVIEESAFLMDGRAEIYQIMENNEAVPIDMFTTDDGETNCGHYKMEWTEEYVDITYRTFVTADSVKTLRVKFID